MRISPTPDVVTRIFMLFCGVHSDNVGIVGLWAEATARVTFLVQLLDEGRRCRCGGANVRFHIVPCVGDLKWGSRLVFDLFLCQIEGDVD